MTREHIPCGEPLQVIAPERLEPKLATIPEQMKAFEAKSKDWEFHVESMAIMKETASFLENYGRGMGGSIGPHQHVLKLVPIPAEDFAENPFERSAMGGPIEPELKKAADAARTRVSGYPAERRRELEGQARALMFRSSVL